MHGTDVFCTLFCFPSNLIFLFDFFVLIFFFIFIKMKSEIDLNYRFKNKSFNFFLRGFRISSLIMYGYSIGWINTHTNVSLAHPTNNFGGSFKYFSYWNLLIQFILFTLIVYCDIFINKTIKHSSKRYNVLIKLRDTVHHSLALPLGMVRSFSLLIELFLSFFLVFILFYFFSSLQSLFGSSTIMIEN